jgi:hypothetical protein
MQKVSAHTKKQCLGVYLEMPAGVLPYTTYLFMLHDLYTIFTLLVNICSSNQSTALNASKKSNQIAAKDVSSSSLTESPRKSSTGSPMAST